MIPTIPKDKLPKISVITVSYNQGQFIRQNFDSVLAQNYPSFEQIVVDGGSQDETIEILKSYKHISWTSEPDRGQTHALNKGFKRATGDIIVWLNSDDWLPEGVFSEIVEHLRDYPIVMGACQVTDKGGAPTEYVPNVCRSWFDILKYWIFYSSPSQPSIFFRREILEEFKLSDGEYLDEGLDFCMDYEFWLRITRRYPMVRYIPKVLSYCRTYDTNKTGQDMDSVYREMSRVYSRYSNVDASAERKLSFLIPFTEFSEDVKQTVGQAKQQSLQDFEILLVDYNTDAKVGKQNRRHVLDFEKTVTGLNIRYLRCLDGNIMQAINHGSRMACAPLIAVVPPGSQISSTLCFETSNLFRQDIFGLVLPFQNWPEMQSLGDKSATGGTGGSIKLVELFSSGYIPPVFIARKVALMEIEGIKSWQNPAISMRELILRLTCRGWHVRVDTSLDIKFPNEAQQNFNAFISLFINYINAKLFNDIYAELSKDEFGKLRAKNGFALVLPDGLISNAKNLLSQAPQNWELINYDSSVEDLIKHLNQYPKFAPISYLLAQKMELQGKNEDAATYLSNFKTLREQEQI